MARSWLKRRRSRGATASRAFTTLESCTISPEALRTKMRDRVSGEVRSATGKRHRHVILLAADLEGA